MSKKAASSSLIDERPEKMSNAVVPYSFEPLLSDDEIKKRRSKLERDYMWEKPALFSVLFWSSYTFFRYNNLLNRLMHKSEKLTAVRDWCLCMQCETNTLSKPKEGFCCMNRELNCFRSKIGSAPCVILWSEFQEKCLDTKVKMLTMYKSFDQRNIP